RGVPRGRFASGRQPSPARRVTVGPGEEREGSCYDFSSCSSWQELSSGPGGRQSQPSIQHSGRAPTGGLPEQAQKGEHQAPRPVHEERDEHRGGFPRWHPFLSLIGLVLLAVVMAGGYLYW